MRFLKCENSDVCYVLSCVDVVVVGAGAAAAKQNIHFYALKD